MDLMADCPETGTFGKRSGSGVYSRDPDPTTEIRPMILRSPTPFLLTLGLSLTLCCQAQWREDFSDGDLSASGTWWQGQTGHFLVTPQGELRLNAPAAGLSRLYTRQFVPDSARWEFYVRLDFSPSNTNQLGFLLMMDHPEPAQANGYYLEAGETGSADALRLFRYTNGQRTLLASGQAGAMGGAVAEARVRLERDAQGVWTLLADYTGGRNFQQEFTITETFHAPGDSFYFGPVCLYTATRTDRFYFDDFAIGPLIPDTVPPALLALEVLDAQELVLRFDESLREEEASDPERFVLLPDDRRPSLAEWRPEKPDEVRLVWAEPLANFREYVLEMRGLADVNGNSADTLRRAFTVLVARAPRPGELLYSEIMANPNPPAGLPDAEYLELYNPTGELLHLGGLQVRTGSSTSTLPPALLWPDSFLILTRPEFVSLFQPYGTTLGVPSLPTLPNDGTRLVLADPSGRTIHEVPYSSGWHATTAKRNGGWSLELATPGLRCAPVGQWRSSEHPSGGTPGRRNSIHQEATDQSGPRLVRVWPITPERLRLTFDEVLGPDPRPEWVRVEPGLGVTAVQPGANGAILEITLSQPLTAGQTYRVLPQAELSDCLDNAYTLQQDLPVALPESPAPGDLLINEILFNPPTGGSDFVELYNASGKVFALQNLLLGNMQPGREETRPVQWEALCFPGDHVVFTSDTAFTRAWWPDADPALLFQATIPAWLNDSGNVTLFLSEGPDLVLLDQMNYHRDMHFSLIRDVKGVSLERMSPALPAGERRNWQSAAEAVGFATPTRRNSQYTELPLDEPGPFTLADPLFSPDGDGVRDQLVLTYRFEESGVVLHARVFDRQGRLVRVLANSQFLGREGLLSWGGEADGGFPAGPGAYILWLETFELSGRVRQYKYPVILALPLE